MSKEYSPEIIAQSFIKQFYEMLAKNPSELHRFYKDESSFAHADVHQVTRSVTGVDSIREIVNNLELAGARLDLSEGSLDAQKSDNNGVFLVVTGHFTLPGKNPRPFVQSFFLACQSASGQKSGSASYYVRNSVFRLLGNDDEAVKDQGIEEHNDPPESYNVSESHFIQASVEDPPSASVEAPYETQVDFPSELSDPLFDDNQVAVDASDDHAEKEELFANNDSSPEPSPSPPQELSAVDLTVHLQPTTLKSFADIVKTWGPTETAPVAAPSSGKPVSGRARSRGSPQTSSAQAGSEDAHSAVASPPDRPPRANASLYVNQLSEGVVESDLSELFSPFGAIRKIDLHGKGYAFVDYVESPSVINALEALAANPSAFTIRGTSIHVEERQNKPKSGKSPRGGGGRDRRPASQDKPKKEGAGRNRAGEKSQRPASVKVSGEKEGGKDIKSSQKK